MEDKLKSEMSQSRHAAVNEECARLNARSVVQRMDLMQEQLDGYKNALDQLTNRLMQLQSQLQLQAQLAMQLQEHGRGPTA